MIVIDEDHGASMGASAGMPPGLVAEVGGQSGAAEAPALALGLVVDSQRRGGLGPYPGPWDSQRH